MLLINLIIVQRNKRRQTQSWEDTFILWNYIDLLPLAIVVATANPAYGRQAAERMRLHQPPVGLVKNHRVLLWAGRLRSFSLRSPPLACAAEQRYRPYCLWSFNGDHCAQSARCISTRCRTRMIHGASKTLSVPPTKSKSTRTRARPKSRKICRKRSSVSSLKPKR